MNGSRRYTVIGLMSGTSADGIDAALVITDGEHPPVLQACLTLDYTPVLRQQILALIQPGENELDRLGDLDRELGEWFARAALAVCQQAGLATSQVDLIASHGQTVRHRPPRFTWQIASPAILAARTGITTIADFRPADLAQGGEGAPLTPAFHQCLFQKPGVNTAVVNLGGIANITALPGNPEQPVLAGDCGPANSLLDMLAALLSQGAEKCDLNGQHAARGQVDEQALHWLLSHPYLGQPYPKSTGREIFGLPFLQQFLSRFPDMADNDRFATLTRFTMAAVADACCRLLPPAPHRVVLAGGGARNPAMIRHLAACLPQAALLTSDQLDVDADSLEAQAFAWFAVRTWRGLTSSLPGATGARQGALLGAIHPGRNWSRLHDGKFSK